MVLNGLGERIISLETLSYNPLHYQKLLEVEDEHFWFQSRNKIIEVLLHQVIKNYRPGFRILEVGSGTGNTLRVLEKICSRGKVIGTDLFEEAVNLARRRVSCEVIKADICNPEFDGMYHGICMFDVLEHLSNPEDVLNNIYELLEEDGFIFLTVPASPALWSNFDLQANHQKRYRTKELRFLLEKVGFTLEYLTPFMATLFPFIYFERKLIRKILSPKNQRKGIENEFSVELKLHPAINFTFNFLIHQEIRIIRRRWKMPWGTSILALARKTNDIRQ